MNTESTRLSVINRNGFVMPVVILAMVVLGALALASLATANDEVRSSRAMRESGTALYAAEAGANFLLATVVDAPSTVLDTLAANMSPGDSVDLGWTTLSNGSAYRGVLYQYGTEAFALNMTGRDVGLRPAEQSISYALKFGSVAAGLALSGAVSGGAAPNNGDMYVSGGAEVNGFDVMPGWWDAGSCPPPEDQAGITWEDDGNIDDSGGDVYGVPDIVEDPSVDPFDFGEFDYDELVDLATITYGGDADINVGPRVSGGECEEHRRNWGDPLDPSGLCFDRFPIIHIGGKLTLYGYGQGILLVDGDIDIKEDVEFYGLIAGQGDIYVLSGAQVYGAIVGGDDINVTDADGVQYSSCALTRAASSLSSGGGLQPIGTRPWSAFLR